MFDPWIGKIPWRREWLPTPVFLPGKSLGQRSLNRLQSMGSQESDTTERLTLPLFTLLTCIDTNFKKNYLFTYLACWILVVALRIFSCGMWDLVPWSGIEPGLLATRAWGLSHWTIRDVLHRNSLNRFYLSSSFPVHIKILYRFPPTPRFLWV